MAQPPNVVQPLPTGCRLNVWPYFQSVWLFASQPITETFRLEAYRGQPWNPSTWLRLAVLDMGVP